MAAEQVDQFETCNNQVVKQTSWIINELLTPVMFKDGKFPVVLDGQVKIWKDISEESYIYDEEGDEGVYSYESMVYYTRFKQNTTVSANFAKKIFGMQSYFIELLSTQYGLEGTTNPFRFGIRYIEPDDECTLANILYPARPVCANYDGYCNPDRDECDKIGLKLQDQGFNLFRTLPLNSADTLVYFDFFT